MKKNRFILKLCLISLLLNFSIPLYSQNQNEAKDKKEVPQALQDIRRFEIISLGSLPFVILDANLVYSGIKYFQNDMNKDYFPSLSPNITKDEQTKLLLTSAGISLGIGITDLIVNIVKRSKKQKARPQNDKNITINPLEEYPNAVKIPSPANLIDEDEKVQNETKDVIDIVEDD